MDYQYFLTQAEALSAEEESEYTLLPGWAAMDRPAVNEVVGDYAVISCTDIILQRIPIRLFRIDTNGGMYLPTRLVDMYKRGVKPKFNDEKPPEPEKPVEPPTKEPPRFTERPHKGLSAKEATGQQLQDILEYHTFLKVHGRADEIGVDLPF